MLKTKYYRDMNHNYLIIDCNQMTVKKHPLMMITQNNIKGLLNTSLRNIDGESFLYYEINSLQTLKSLFENKKMEKVVTIRLFSSLCRVLKEIKKYLLSDQNLLLDPEFIYLDWEKEEIYYVYCPFEDVKAAGQIKTLFDYLVRIIDHHDEKLTDMVYGLCGLAERNAFNIDDLERHLSGITYDKGDEQEIIASEELELCSNEKHEPHNEISVVSQTDDISGKEAKEKRKLLILTFVSAIGAISTAIYKNFYVLAAKEELLSWVLLIVFVIFFLLTGCICIILNYRSKNNKSNKGKAQFAENDFQRIVTENQVDEYCGDTVFLSDIMNENRLYGVGEGSKYIIDLLYFPFIIGKLADSTDFCIFDSTISRFHAKFTQYENIVFMTDLNSTNGTYKNGLRLEPNETVLLEAGNEVRFGKLDFYFR
ncbi:MAG: FHA domain-containing protein [Lachnospiraceae bacterium]|nr:FHA domain-containing protein [Lachnospiraceae bacterium]